MNTMNTLTALAAMTLASGASKAEESSTVCAPTIIALRTDFPAYAQRQRQHGEVRLAIHFGNDGRVVAARVAQSSGHGALDSEAAASARKHWRFQVAHCTDMQLAQEYIVSVTYRRPPGPTMSGTVNRKALARTRRLLADSRCHATKPAHDAMIFACIDAATLDGVTVQR